MKGLKPYMGYSRESGSFEGAVLIFAHNLKEAKKIGWPVLHGMFVDDFIDMSVHLIKDGDYLFEQMPKWSKEKLASDIPHVLDSPPSCTECNSWGVGEFNDKGLCEDCAENES